MIVGRSGWSTIMWLPRTPNLLRFDWNKKSVEGQSLCCRCVLNFFIEVGKKKPMTLDRAKFCESCSQVVSLACEYKQYCRNSDQLVCIETCAKLCHFACFCAMTNQLDQGMLTKLRDVCEWCNEVCDKIGMNQARKCCDDFHRSCSDIVEMSSTQESLYRGQTIGIDQGAVDALGAACQKLYCRCIVEKPGYLMDRRLDHDQLAQVEACCKLCSVVTFMCMNVRCHIDTNIVECCKRMCSACIACECCEYEARSVITACTECMQRSSELNGMEEDGALMTSAVGQPNLSNLINSLIESSSYRS